jgi:hypothetical protein
VARATARLGNAPAARKRRRPGKPRHSSRDRLLSYEALGGSVVTEPGHSSQGQGPAAVDPGVRVVSDSDSGGPPATRRLAARRGPGRPPAVTGRAQARGSRPAVIVSGAAATARLGNRRRRRASGPGGGQVSTVAAIGYFPTRLWVAQW